MVDSGVATAKPKARAAKPTTDIKVPASQQEESKKNTSESPGKGTKKTPNDSEQPETPEPPRSDHSVPPSADIGGPPPAKMKKKAAKKPSPLNPEANEFPLEAAPPAPASYDELLAEIAALRSRAQALTTKLFASKLRVVVSAEGDHTRLTRLVITLDGGVIHRAPARFVAPDQKVVYDHAVAPGHHVLGIEVESYDTRGRQYTVWRHSRVSLVVPEKRVLEASIELEDDSDMAEDFPDDQDGEYSLELRVRAHVEEP